MNFRSMLPRLLWLFAACYALLQSGCATTSNKVDWAGRVGSYTYDQSVLELGPPDKAADLSDGRRVAQWVIKRGNSETAHSWMPGGWIFSDDSHPLPDQLLTLTFGPDGVLKDSKRSTR